MVVCPSVVRKQGLLGQSLRSIFRRSAGCFSCGNRMLPNILYVVLRLRQTQAGAAQDFTSKTQFFRSSPGVAFQTPATVAVILPERSELQSFFDEEQFEPRKCVHVTSSSPRLMENRRPVFVEWKSGHS